MIEKLILAATITFALHFFISPSDSNMVKSAPEINTAETPEHPTHYLLVKGQSDKNN